MLNLSAVKKSYGSTLILDLPSFALDAGTYWLKGANGSGKSTFMKMVAGMIPFEGSIEVNSVNLNKDPVTYRRLVNYSEAEPLYPPFLSGTDLIHFFIATRKASHENSKRLIDAFGIGSFIQNPVHTYSSGMNKKLSLVLGFIGQPKLILLDEPFVTLDQASWPVLYQLIRERNEQGISFLFTSHQPPEEDLLPATTELFVENHTVCFL